jgi:hypothetical protein
MKPAPKNPESNSKPNYFLVVGVVLAVQSAAMKAEGPATGALKIFGGIGGAALCCVALVQETKKWQKK